jgi:hypothetical protein
MRLLLMPSFTAASSFSLLCNDCLNGVHPQPRSRHVNQHWIHAFLGRRRYRVAETDVYLQWNHSLVQRGPERGSYAAVLLVFTDLFRLHRVCVEQNPVIFDGGSDDLADHGSNRGGRSLSSP